MASITEEMRFASVYVNTPSNMASQRQQESIIRTAS